MKLKMSPENTERIPPMAILADAIFGGVEDHIERMEAKGQKELAASDVLPTDMSHDARETLESYGVRFLGPVKNDPLFQWVELPDGWKIEPTGHSMWSDLQDEQGRIRAKIFYKAAFYDRSAHLTLRTRYNLYRNYEVGDQTGRIVWEIRDGEKVLYSLDVALPDDQDERYKASNKLRDDTKQWLDMMYPDWQDPSAYWEDKEAPDATA